MSYSRPRQDGQQSGPAIGERRAQNIVRTFGKEVAALIRAQSGRALAVQADGSQIETIEGLTERGAIADLQQEFVARNALGPSIRAALAAEKP